MRARTTAKRTARNGSLQSTKRLHLSVGVQSAGTKKALAYERCSALNTATSPIVQQRCVCDHFPILSILHAFRTYRYVPSRRVTRGRGAEDDDDDTMVTTTLTDHDGWTDRTTCCGWSFCLSSTLPIDGVSEQHGYIVGSPPNERTTLAVKRKHELGTCRILRVDRKFLSNYNTRHGIVSSHQGTVEPVERSLQISTHY